MSPELVEDGFGSVAEKCALPDCGLHVCRPGDIRCYHALCPDDNNCYAERGDAAAPPEKDDEANVRASFESGWEGFTR